MRVKTTFFSVLKGFEIVMNTLSACIWRLKHKEDGQKIHVPIRSSMGFLLSGEENCVEYHNTRKERAT